MMHKILLLSLASTLLSCTSGIKKSRVCSIADFDPLKGCKSHSSEISELPETLVYSFRANGFDKDSRAAIFWYYGEGASALPIDSFIYYTKVDKELVVSGIDRNFLEPGPYFVKAVISNKIKTVEHIEKFSIRIGDELAVTQLLIGDRVDENGRVINPNTAFSANEQHVFISANVHNAKAKQEINIRFEHKNQKFDKSFSTTLGAHPKSSFLLFANLPNLDLPEGEYDAQIKMGEFIYAASFFVNQTNVSNTEKVD